ncbi:formylglycine-generating enzyme family protein [Haliscomenobacter hydrossis]|uniref:Sulphatase-modifying factor protein n=1 Tax=Haliscomenobacter hydrossis (strain ATCC 27775 / DSM 1100 / LMG 10767 / O) TaxID=760192 RepID=F4KTY4_HALH1|nr:formylglycine-generating enzyme family protein [Haliscomenobacter hydrossis]AEE49120.1 Sulphatase-modifying factor protein [Haliscomenobacter hydrossis DSM 1100]
MPQPAPRVYIQEFTAANGQPFAFQMVEVKGGTFQMGREDEDADDDEKPVHPVKVSDFWMAEYVVTQAFWQAVMGEENVPFYFQGDKRPAERVSWETIVEQFLPRLNEMTGENYRLPSEAEWEYAARGGINHSPYKYAGSNRLKEVAWYYENSHSESKPVGLKKPNALGLYDMSGNVYEWCADWYGSDYYQECLDAGVVENPTGRTQGSDRVVRGGDWYSSPGYCRVSYRDRYDPRYGYDSVGFRLVVCVLQSVGWEKRLKPMSKQEKNKIK